MVFGGGAGWSGRITLVPTVVGKNLTQRYRVGDEDVYALDRASLEINPGDFLAIVGRSGSGKSTLLHVLGCLQRPGSGTVSIEGVDVTRLDDDEMAKLRAQKFGFVFQAFNLLPKETALGNVAVGLKSRGLDAWSSREKAEEALAYVGLRNRMDHRPGQLSAQQRQLVAIARALAHDPVVILADEPTRPLDSTSREEVMGIFQKLNDDGRTIAISTADSGVATYCHRALRLADGRVVDDAPVAKRRIIPPSRIIGTQLRSYERETTVCPRCNYGNFIDAEACQRCQFPLHLTLEKEQTIESRVSGTDVRWSGVESSSDDADVTGTAVTRELMEVPLFAGLGPKILVKIIPALNREYFSGGSTILKQGDPGDSFYIIRRGAVRVTLERQNRQTVTIAELGDKEGFGEMALLTDQPRSATVVALEDVEAWSLTKTAFHGLLSENLSLALYVNRILSQRLRTIQDRILP